MKRAIKNKDSLKNPKKLVNMHKLSSLKYVVWTQAGFNKAIRKVNSLTCSELMVEGFPTKYPCSIEFVYRYRGYHYWELRCITLSKAIEVAKNTLEVLLRLDEEHK